MGSVAANAGDIFLCRDTGQVHVCDGGVAWANLGIAPTNHWAGMKEGPVEENPKKVEEEDRLNKLESKVDLIGRIALMSPEERTKYIDAKATLKEAREKDPFWWVEE